MNDIGEFLWSLLVIYFIIFYFMLLFRILGDLFGDHELSGWAKTGWIIFMLILPFLSIFVYLIVRGKGMYERAGVRAKAAKPRHSRTTSGRWPARPGPRPTRARQIAKAHDLLQSGAINQQEFDALKAKALA